MQVSSKLVMFLQLLALPAELLTEICTYLDPRSWLHLSEAHSHCARILNAKVLWTELHLTSNWVFHNETFLFICQFRHHIERVVIDHTSRMPRYIVSFAEASLSGMPNLKCLSVRSPYFEFCHFLKHTPQIEVLLFITCPRFDVETFFDCVRNSKNLRILDLRGVPNLSSMDTWRMSNHLKKLSQLYLDVVMSDIFAEEVFENCPNLTHFDCVAPEWSIANWKKLADKFPWIQLGPKLHSCL